MLPGPKVYDPDNNLDRVMNRSDHLLGVMLKGRMITEDEYMEALVEIPLTGQASVSMDTDLDQGSVEKTSPLPDDKSIPVMKQLPADPVNTEFDPQLSEGSSPPIEDEPIPGVQEIPAISQSAVEDAEMLTTQDGIIEIPIKTN
jgi:hypothetical protein